MSADKDPSIFSREMETIVYISTMAEYVCFSLDATGKLKLSIVDRIQLQSAKFATGVENEVTGDSKLNDNPEYKVLWCFVYLCFA